jgi:hypothetical protein
MPKSTAEKIDFDEKAFVKLIQAAVSLNESSSRQGPHG